MPCSIRPRLDLRATGMHLDWVFPRPGETGPPHRALYQQLLRYRWAPTPIAGGEKGSKRRRFFWKQWGRREKDFYLGTHPRFHTFPWSHSKRRLTLEKVDPDPHVYDLESHVSVSEHAIGVCVGLCPTWPLVHFSLTKKPARLSEHIMIRSVAFDTLCLFKLLRSPISMQFVFRLMPWLTLVYYGGKCREVPMEYVYLSI